MVPSTHDVMDGPGTGPHRTWTIVLSLSALLVAVAAVIGVVLLTSQAPDDLVVSSPTSTPTPSQMPSATASPTPTQQTTPTVPATPTPDPVVEGALRRLGSVVQAAAWGRTEVGAVMAEVTTGCTLEPWEASRRLADVVANREAALAQVSAFPVVGEPGVDESAALLQSAFNHSLQADRGYQRWVDETYGRYYYEHTTWPENPETEQPVTDCPGPAPRSDVLDEAERLSDLSQDAKDAFVALYNPLAEKYGLAMWSSRDF